MLRSIYARTFLLIFVTVVVAQGVSLLVPVDRSIPVMATRIEDLVRQLRPREAGPPTAYDDERQPPPGLPPPEIGRPYAPGGPGGPLDLPLREFMTFEVHGSNIEPRPKQMPAAPDLQAELASRAGVSSDQVRFYAQQSALPLRSGFVAAIRQPDGRWRVAEREPTTFPSPLQVRAAKILALELLALLPLAWLFARALAAPVRRFADAARIVGQDASGGAPLPREGPTEVQAAIDAFNAMQARINRLIQERTRMVGAIAHDLRTPLTRLAFRLDDLPAPLSDKVHGDIDEMKSMISAALEFIRDRSLHLQRERLDLRLLVERVANDLADLGHDVTLQGGAPVTVEGVPLALRRLVSNLLENAVKYGQRARVRLTLAAERCTLEVDDDGPGIPETLHEQVFEPFYRVEGSRNRDTGGIGLGLSAVRAIALEHGGEVRLGNRREGGLRASVSLPVVRS